ncbi:MAG: FCD domain-containing protein [Spirochaetales bacterium]|nr:FCD domain-containing protein [Spirochaetales bacterium]
MDSPFGKIVVPKVPNLIIQQILDKVVSEELNPGDKLPSEPQLQVIFEVSRPQLKSAFKRLENFGIVETRPQSGTYMAPYGRKILEGLLTNVLQLDEHSTDYRSLMDTRRLIEVRAAELSAPRITDRELKKIRQANEVFRQNATQDRAIDDDIHFHLLIVSTSGSPVLNSQYCILTPDMIDFWKKLDVMEEEMVRRTGETIAEHEAIIAALEAGDGEACARAMTIHMDNTYSTAEMLMKKYGELK